MCASLALAQQTTSPAPPAPKLTLPYNPGRPTPPPAPSFGNGIDYHNGPIMPRINVYYIFYGSWRGDDAVTHLENVARNIGGTYWWNINSTYTDTTGARAGPAIFHAGSIFDESLSAGNTLTTQGIRDVVSSAILQRRLPLDESAVYVVAASAGVTVPGLCTEFCGWHTAGWVTQDGATRTVKLAFVGDTRKCPSACGAQTLTPNNSVAADGMVSVFAHELAEAATDPEINAWYDSNGLENADKCSWMFGTTSRAPNGAGTNIVLGAYRYLIQQNWVNAGGGYCAMQYGGPAVTGMNPTSGAAGSAISVTIRGTNFEPGVTLEPSGTGLTVTDLRLASSNELTATITAAAGAEAGVREMRLVQRGAEYLLSFTVTQALPVLTSVTW